MSGDQEPWVFRGGLTSDLQVITVRYFIRKKYLLMLFILFIFISLNSNKISCFTCSLVSCVFRLVFFLNLSKRGFVNGTNTER